MTSPGCVFHQLISLKTIPGCFLFTFLSFLWPHYYTVMLIEFYIAVMATIFCLRNMGRSNVSIVCDVKQQLLSLPCCCNNGGSTGTWTCSPLWVPDGWLAAQMQSSASVYSLSPSLRSSWDSHSSTPLHQSNNTGGSFPLFGHNVLVCLGSNSVLFSFTYTIKIVFRRFTEAQGLTLQATAVKKKHL